MVGVTGSSRGSPAVPCRASAATSAAARSAVHATSDVTDMPGVAAVYIYIGTCNGSVNDSGPCVKLATVQNATFSHARVTPHEQRIVGAICYTAIYAILYAVLYTVLYAILYYML